MSLIVPRDSLALFANDYHDGSLTTGCVLRTIRAGNLPTRPASKKHEDSLSVHYWTRKEFRSACVAHANTQRGETDSDTMSAHGNGKHGHPKKGTDKDNKRTHFYLENIDGMPITDKQIAKMSRKARMLWRTLDSDSMAPPSFGQISMQVLRTLCWTPLHVTKKSPIMMKKPKYGQLRWDMPRK